MLFSSVMTKFTAKNRPFKLCKSFVEFQGLFWKIILELANVETKFEERSLCYTPADLACDSRLLMK